MSVLLVTADLMTGSQVSAAARQSGARLQTALNVAAVPGKLATGAPRLVIVDLGAVGPALTELVPMLRALSPTPTIIAFGPHVQTELLAQAAAAGCDQVLTRGQFHAQAAAILAQFAKP